MTAAVALQAPAHHAQGGNAATVAAAGVATPHYWTRHAQPAAPLRQFTAQATNPGGGVVLFGGQTSTQTPALLAETWVWTDQAWSRRSPAVAPSARVQGQFSHNGDGGAGQAVLFGGRSTTVGPIAGAPAMGDTWIWDGAAWTQRHPAVSPPPTYGGVMAADGAGNVVLYGGFVNGQPSYLTWVWNGTTWRHASSAGPVLVSIRASTLASGGLLLQGRLSAAGTTETWTWHGGAATWTQLHPATDPGPSRGMALDGDGRNVLIGDPGTWTWDGTDWIAVPLAVNPFLPTGVVVPDGAGRIVYGAPGYETWVWQPVAGHVTSITSGGGSQATAILTPYAQRLRAHARDSQGVAILGVPVTFRLPTGGPSGTFPGAARSASGLTGTGGAIDAPILTANKALGSFLVSATSPGVSQSASYSMRNTPTPVSVVAAVGTNHALYVRRSTASAFTNLGGYLIDAPAVARTADGTVYYIGRGANSRLYIRTDRLPWKLLTGPGVTCQQPGAAGGDGYLSVGCRGSNNHLLTMSIVYVTNGGLPQHEAFPDDVGGVITSGPSVTMDFGQLFKATAPAAAGATNVWEYDTWRSTWSRLPVSCSAQPGASRALDTWAMFHACRTPSGSLQFWSGFGGGPVADAGGAIVGPPGVAAHVTHTSATVYARGTNGQVYVTKVHADSGMGFTASEPWRSLGGKVLYGVGAVALAG